MRFLQYFKMPEIKQIDVQVFPDYAGGTYMGSAYVDKTGEVRYFNTHASQSLVKQWQKIVRGIEQDPARMCVHVNEGEGNTSSIKNIQRYVRFLTRHLEPTGRLIEIAEGELEADKLRGQIEGSQLYFSPDVQLVGYGHHRGDCVPKVGRKVAACLGLDESRFKEIEALSVGDKVVDRVNLLKGLNPTLYDYYSGALFKQWRAQRQYERVGHVMDQQRYLFLFCTKKQICEAAARVSSVKEFEDLIGGDFKIWRYTEYYTKEVSTRRHLDF